MNSRILFLVSAAALSAIASAGLTQVYSRAALNANDVFDWGQFTLNTNIPSTTVALSSGGLSGTLTTSDNSMFTVSDSAIWGGTDFPANENLLQTFTTANIGFTLANPVSAIGVMVDSGEPGPFTGTMTVYDVSGNSLGSFSNTGDSEYNPGGSAAFLGVVSTSVNIGSIAFNNSTNDAGNTFDQVSIDTLAPTPEPAALAALGVGIIGLLLRRRKSS